MPSYLYKFMKNTSKEILKSDIIFQQTENHEKEEKVSNDECDSQLTSQSAISIHKRYNQSSNDKQFMNN